MKRINMMSYVAYLDCCVIDSDGCEQYEEINFSIQGNDVNNICLSDQGLLVAKNILWKHYIKEQLAKITDKVLCAAIKSFGAPHEKLQSRESMETVLVHRFAWDIWSNQNLDDLDQKNKELFLCDICGRLIYGFRGKFIDKSYDAPYDPLVDNIKIDFRNPGMLFNMEIKPYLFPLSSLTEEQQEDMYNACGVKIIHQEESLEIAWDGYEFSDFGRAVDYFHRNNLDYRGLIPKGLAIDATGLNIYN